MKLLKLILHFCYTMRLIGMALVFTALMRICGGETVDAGAASCGTLLWLMGQITVNITKYVKSFMERNYLEGSEKNGANN